MYIAIVMMSLYLSQNDKHQLCDSLVYSVFMQSVMAEAEKHHTCYISVEGLNAVSYMIILNAATPSAIQEVQMYLTVSAISMQNVLAS